MKRGSANMWWIIIGAVIALVVMIILMVIFSDGTEKANTGLFDCASKGGVCKTFELCKGEGGSDSMVFSCPSIGGEERGWSNLWQGRKGEAQVCCFTEK